MHNRRKRNAVVLSLLLVLSSAALFVTLVVWLRNVFIMDRKPLLFGSTYMTMDNQYFEVLNAFIENFVEVNGDRLITRDPANSQTKQNEQILDMLDMGVDFIFVNPVDGHNVEPALKECARRGVPFIAVDTETFNYFHNRHCIYLHLIFNFKQINIFKFSNSTKSSSNHKKRNIRI